MQYTARYSSPLGPITLASDGKAIIGLWFDGQKYDRSILTPGCQDRDLPVFAQAAEWLDRYFAGREPDFTPPLALSCSSFRREVLEILQRIPYGQVTTYGAIARAIAQNHRAAKMSAQAVGGAVGRNPISLMIPCHRVVGADGSLTGYGGGVARKLALLELERANTQALFVPKKGTAL